MVLRCIAGCVTVRRNARKGAGGAKFGRGTPKLVVVGVLAIEESEEDVDVENGELLVDVVDVLEHVGVLG